MLGDLLAATIPWTACFTTLYAVVVQIEGSSYRLRQHAELMPEHLRLQGDHRRVRKAPPPRRRSRPPNSSYPFTTA